MMDKTDKMREAIIPIPLFRIYTQYLCPVVRTYAGERVFCSPDFEAKHAGHTYVALTVAHMATADATSLNPKTPSSLRPSVRRVGVGTRDNPARRLDRRAADFQSPENSLQKQPRVHANQTKPELMPFCYVPEAGTGSMSSISPYPQFIMATVVFLACYEYENPMGKLDLRDYL